MNAVEIEEAVSALAEQPFDPAAFPYAFLEAFGNKATTLKRLRAGGTNKSDLGGMLQTNNIHLATCPVGAVTATLTALKASPATTRAKAKFILATDGVDLEAEDLLSGETIACAYPDFPDHFGFFLPLAGITTVKQIRESAFDIKATGRLNRLYVELLKDNPDWGAADRRADMNHFLARLIFCFFAEDTDIFPVRGLFTKTIDQMSARDAADTHAIIGELFCAMNLPYGQRAAAKVPRWADAFPYVNGGLFAEGTAVPRFSKIARTYLLHIGNLDWQKINPDIFGSMIQAVAEDEERGALGMHYTSVPNILKVLNPLFLDDLRAKLEEAGENPRKLLNLRHRIARIRVFDPACGSGNFLVIAYKELRAIEAEINRRRGEAGRKSDIPLTNFRGIEIRDFPAEIARLALIIAEYQCDVLYRGQKEALAEFLPLQKMNWITCGNALRLDWLKLCPPTGTVVKRYADDLFATPLLQAEIDFENEGGETYICGNPPYLGTKKQTIDHKRDLEAIFTGHTKSWRSLDYVSGWFMKAAEYSRHTRCTSAFVSTNSICQGQQVSILWPLILDAGCEILFAHTNFKWANLASHNAGVTVVVVSITNDPAKERKIFTIGENGAVISRTVENINPYLVQGNNVLVDARPKPISAIPDMYRGNSPTDGGNLLLRRSELPSLDLTLTQVKKFIKPFFGADEVIYGLSRLCIWIDDKDSDQALAIKGIRDRVDRVREFRLQSPKAATQKAAKWPHRFDERKPLPESRILVIPIRSSENRTYLPVDFLQPYSVIANTAFWMIDAPIWTFSLIASRLHTAWISTVCARLELRFSYTNTVGWNTFPVPLLTEKNKADLTCCAEDILLTREAHFPATIADLYDPDTMPDDLRAAHDRNDEVLERIYIGRRFKNDTERLEKLFEMYTQMTQAKAGQGKPAQRLGMH